MFARSCNDHIMAYYSVVGGKLKLTDEMLSQCYFSKESWGRMYVDINEVRECDGKLTLRTIEDDENMSLLPYSLSSSSTCMINQQKSSAFTTNPVVFCQKNGKLLAMTVDNNVYFVEGLDLVMQTNHLFTFVDESGYSVPTTPVSRFWMWVFIALVIIMTVTLLICASAYMKYDFRNAKIDDFINTPKIFAYQLY